VALLSSTKKIIETVEELTNRPVYIREDPSLETLAHIQIARGDAPMHLLRYKPRGEELPDYFIAYQCGFVIRLWSTPPEKRFDFGPSEEGHAKMQVLLSDSAITEPVRKMGDFLLNNLMTQLRTYPIGLRIESWLLNDFPELRELQKKGIHTQLEQNTQALAVGSRGLFPAKIYKANASMNAAFAAFWSKEWNDPALTAPYKVAGFLDSGLRLLKILDRIPDEPAFDVELVDAWAQELGIKGWYRTIPYKLNE
jgi:hypothetical protein